MNWSEWANTALARMRAPGWEIRDEDANLRGGAREENGK